MPHGPEAARPGSQALSGIHLVRMDDRVLNLAGELFPAAVRSLEAIHLSTARPLAESLGRIVRYDRWMRAAARGLLFRIAAPA